MQLSDTLEYLWKWIIVDFITQLSLLYGYNVIIVYME